MKINIHSNIINPNFSLPKISSSLNKSNDRENIINTQTAFSKQAIFKYELSSRFSEQLNNSTNASSFIADFAIEYNKMKDEITMNYSDEDQESMLKMLDEVYNDSVNQAASSLSKSFEYFFDLPANLNKRYGMEESEGRFNEDEFKNHLINIANEAKSIASNTVNRDDIETRLLEQFQNQGLTKMSFSDIRSLTNVMGKISAVKNLGLSGDSKEFGKNLADFEKNAEEILNNANLSENIRTAAKDALLDTVDSYKRVGAYVQAHQNIQANLEEQFKEMDRIASLIRQNEELLKELIKKYGPTHPLVQRHLEQGAALKENVKGVSELIKSMKAQRDDLHKNPNSAVDTKEYLEIQEGYNERKKNVSKE